MRSVFKWTWHKILSDRVSKNVIGLERVWDISMSVTLASTNLARLCTHHTQTAKGLFVERSRIDIFVIVGYNVQRISVNISQEIERDFKVSGRDSGEAMTHFPKPIHLPEQGRFLCIPQLNTPPHTVVFYYPRGDTPLTECIPSLLTFTLTITTTGFYRYPDWNLNNKTTEAQVPIRWCVFTSPHRDIKNISTHTYACINSTLYVWLSS